jgi:hypothetical protein
MEDVLEVYHQPRDPECPLVCLDETSKQLTTETRVPIPAEPGQLSTRRRGVARYDYEYERNGTANLFMLFAPLEGWRHVEVTDRHTAVDFAHLLKDLSDTHCPDARKITLVQDNLNTQTPASLYQAFPAAEARRLVERFDWHYTPKHGSWLNIESAYDQGLWPVLRQIPPMAYTLAYTWPPVSRPVGALEEGGWGRFCSLPRGRAPLGRKPGRLPVIAWHPAKILRKKNRPDEQSSHPRSEQLVGSRLPAALTL